MCPMCLCCARSLDNRTLCKYLGSWNCSLPDKGPALPEGVTLSCDCSTSHNHLVLSSKLHDMKKLLGTVLMLIAIFTFNVASAQFSKLKQKIADKVSQRAD